MYDVFVTGIAPHQSGKLAEIKKKLDATLGISDLDLEKLLAPEAAPICLRENVSEAGATKLCSILNKLGLACSYRPHHTNHWQNLSLVPLEEKSDIFTCPACNKQKNLEGAVEPKKCPFCFVDVRSFVAKQKEQEEYEEIRKKLLRKSQHQLEQERLDRLRFEEIKRKQLLEEKIAKELGLQTKFNLKTLRFALQDTRKRYWIPAAMLVLGMAYLSTHQLFANNSPENNFTESAIPEQSMASATVSQQTGDKLAIAKNSQLPDQNDIAATMTPAQAALAQTHSRIGKLLNATPHAEDKTDTILPKEKASKANQLFLESMYSELYNDVEWERFITTQAKALINTGQLKSAYQLSQQQTHLADHIAVVGDLLYTFAKLNRTDLVDASVKKLQLHIQNQPKEQQAVYKAQLGTILQNLSIQNTELLEAEKLALAVKDPVLKSQALSGIATIQKNAGLTDTANRLLQQSEETLKNAAPNFQQFSGYIHLAHDYIKIGFSVNAELAMTQAENLLPKLSPAQQESGLSQLLDTAYLTNNKILIEKYVAHLKTTNFRSNAIYQGILSQFKTNGGTVDPEDLTHIPEHEYAAVATALAALLETDPNKQNALASNAQLELTAIQDPETKALATSKVARYFYRFGHQKEADILFEQALNSARGLTDTEHKDTLLLALAQDNARVFLLDQARQIAKLIHDNNLQATALDLIKNAQQIESAATT